MRWPNSPLTSGACCALAWVNLAHQTTAPCQHPCYAGPQRSEAPPKPSQTPHPARAALLRKSSTAVVIGFVVFLLGWIFQTVVVFGFPYEPGKRSSRTRRSVGDERHGVL